MFDMFIEPESEFFTPDRYVLVDGPYSIFRAFYGYSVDRFKKQDGTPNNGIYGVAKTIQQLIKDVNPTHIMFAFDKGRAGHRQDALPQYKEGRAEAPEELRAQFPLVEEMLELMNIKTLKLDRIEADDIIATLATRAAKENHEVKVFSSDRDMHQLVSDKIHIIRPAHGKPGLEEITPEYLVSKYGLTPEQYPDLAALVGEKADNIPGIPSVGEKTATKWLQEYGNLNNLIAHADDLTGKVGEKFRENIDLAIRNRSINQLLLDAEIGVTLEDIKKQTPNRAELDNFFSDWEIPSLVGKF